MVRKTVEEAIKKLRAAWTGREVRDRMADTIEAMNEEVTNTSSKQSILEETFNNLIINEGNSNAEVVAARVDQNGNSYDTLGKRMNNFDSQLEQSTQQLKGQINEIAEAGTTMEAVQSKVSEMAEHGLIQAYTLADGTVEPKKISFFNTIYGNLFDKKTVVTNKQLNIANGTIGNMTDRTVSDFIKVNSSELLTFIYTQCRVCQYNASKEFISGHSNPITTIITDVNTSYIRVDFPSTRLDEIKIYKGADIPENDETYYKVDDTVDYSNLLTTENLFKIFKENNMSKTENIFNYKNSTLNYSINGSTGEITAFNDYSLSEYIYCESGINLSTNYKNVNINEYDENK